VLRVFSFQQITNGLDWHSLQESANPNFGRSRTRPAKCDGFRFPGADPAPVIAPLGNYSVANGVECFWIPVATMSRNSISGQPLKALGRCLSVDFREELTRDFH